MKTGVSIIVPVLNEAESVSELVDRLCTTMQSSGSDFEILFVDDNSTDATKALIQEHIEKGRPIRYFLKEGRPGKAFSILEGVERADYDTVCMIDADLQYAPENITAMMQLMEVTKSDVIITRRSVNETSRLRRLMSATFNVIFTRAMFGIDYDTQSGLKLFKTDMFKTLNLSPTPWGFDLEFIVYSLLQGYTIASYDIIFEARAAGEAKINVFSSSFELARQSISLRAKISGSQLRKSYVRNMRRLSLESGV